MSTLFRKVRHEDLYLRENDIIIVPLSGTKAFLIELGIPLKG